MDLHFQNKILSIDADGIKRNNLEGNCLVIPGQIEYFAMQTPPLGWLNCDGSSFDPNIYIDLSNAIRTIWGKDGNNYKLPDYRGCFLRNWANDSSTHDSGRVINTIQDSDYKNHKHTFNKNDINHTHSITNYDDGAHSHGLLFHLNWGNGGGIAPAGNDYNSSWRRDTITNFSFDSDGKHNHYNFESNTNDSGTFNINENINSSLESRPDNLSVLVCIKY